MNCLCCNEKLENVKSLKKHCVEHHGVGEENYFYKRLFCGDRVFCPRKCFRCEHFCANGREEKVHNFLSEDKPLKKIIFDANLQKYCINFADHSNFYNFYNFREIISQFLNVFKNNFLLQRNLMPVKFRCSFTIINCQPPPMSGFVETADARVWVSDVYEGVYFNDFIKAGIGNDIKKRIICNGMIESNWRFKRFDRLYISINREDQQSIGQ